MEKICGMRKLVGLQLFWSGTPTFSSGTPTFCQMGVLNSCFQNLSESSDITSIIEITNLNVEGYKSYLPVFPIICHYVPVFPGKCHWHGKYAYLPAFCQPGGGGG